MVYIACRAGLQLVVVVKDTWPPTKPTSIETIAASFVPPTGPVRCSIDFHCFATVLRVFYKCFVTDWAVF